ncbi:WG repeat-containing protein [Flavobacterium jejuense]|uniref:WG repeat-containing protein n=1 Tax=Flavobacterium jejuense TaxID=1544455 RepID=A0ABX0IPC8_9FLAO|nr:WG repeat-containing protein [Flavobacterium jejuense]NHN24328.1 WG repeat-containing protein [Flavobacterium jejuense]
MKQISTIVLLLLFVSCNSKPDNPKVASTKSYATVTTDKDTLFSINKGQFEYGSSCGFVNKKGDTIIPIGTIGMCFTDTFTTFAYVFDKERYGDGMVAINRNKEVIFDAYLFDNGPDYLSDGLFRIMRNGKIGFANEIGEVIIEPKFECAYPFEDGKSKVAYDCETISDDLEHKSWESSHWFYIDKNGNKISAL